MSITNKAALLNYVQFLRESGYLYLDESCATAELVALLSKAPAPPARTAAPVVGQRTQPARRTPSAPVPRERQTPTRTTTRPAANSASATAKADPPAPPRPRPIDFSGPPLTLEERQARFAEVIARAETCRLCEIGHTRNKLVWSDGSPMARIVFVGEAPGADEDAMGIPFVGRGGQLLTKMIEAIGFAREEVYICNTIKCRPPGNRDPLPGEKANCEHFLVEQLQVLRPSMVVALGAHAAQYLFRSEAPIGKLRGQWREYYGIPLLATYHPAFLLRSPGMKPRAWDDFRAIHAKYTELNPDDPRKIWQKG